MKWGLIIALTILAVQSSRLIYAFVIQPWQEARSGENIDTDVSMLDDWPELKFGSNEKSNAKYTQDWISALHQNGYFNGVVLVYKDGEELVSQALGHTDHTLTKQLTTSTSMRLASLSKQFTAAGILRLASEKKLDPKQGKAQQLDTLVSELLPNFQYQDVTVRHLLNQTSGIPDEYMTVVSESLKAKQPGAPNIQKTVELFLGAKIAASNTPESEYEYSNTNYLLLAGIIENVSGQSFEDYMKQKIFEPSGLKNTRVFTVGSKQPQSKDALLAGCYYSKVDSNGMKLVEELRPGMLDGVAGDGGIFSSANDLIHWDKVWSGKLDEPFIAPELLKEAFVQPTLRDGTSSDYGFGWVIDDATTWHNGSWLGANTYFSRNPRTGLLVVVLDNSSNVFVDSIGLMLRLQFD